MVVCEDDPTCCCEGPLWIWCVLFLPLLDKRNTLVLTLLPIVAFPFLSTSYSSQMCFIRFPNAGSRKTYSSAGLLAFSSQDIAAQLSPLVVLLGRDCHL